MTISKDAALIRSNKRVLSSRVQDEFHYNSDRYHGRNALGLLERIITDKSTGAIYYIPITTPLNDEAITQAIEVL